MAYKGDKMIEKMKTSRMIGMFLALCIAVMFLTSSMVVLAQDTEPNNDFWNAITCYDGDIINGVVDYDTDSSDFYQILILADETITATLTTGTPDLDLYDSSESWLDDSWYNALGQPYVEYTAFFTGFYYIEVSTYGAYVDYTLDIDVADQSASGELYVGGTSYVSGDPEATLPTMTVGDGVYWGGVKDIGAEIEDDLDTALADFEDMGFDVSYDINGGIGAYFGIEVAGDSSDINGVTCYDIAITGAIAIDVGFTARVDGTVTDPSFGTVSVDGSGNGFVEVEMNLDGHMYLTVDELALAKIDLTFTAEGQGEIHLDADMSMQGTSQSIRADAEMSINDVQIDFDLAFDPPLDIYQFPMWEGKEWYVPGYDTDVSGSLVAQGTITHDYTVTVPGEPTDSDSGTTNLATEIGTNNFFETIPGGAPDVYDWYGGGGTLFTCIYASGNIFIIETEMGSAFGYGTRQGIPDVESMIPSTGFQFNKETGLITGMTMDGELMTSEVTAAAVEDFAEDPLAEVKSETGGHDAGSGLLGILLIGVIVIVVIVIVVVMLTKKKAPPQQYPPQQYDQQPPPPPTEYQQPADQYQQPPADQYQQPPPPPPPGQ